MNGASGERGTVLGGVGGFAQALHLILGAHLNGVDYCTTLGGRKSCLVSDWGNRVLCHSTSCPSLRPTNTSTYQSAGTVSTNNHHTS
jgi:hypothetical protein